MNPHLALTLAVIAEVIATSALKASDGLSRLGPSIAVVIGYSIALFLLSITMKAIPVGIVYAIWSGAGILLVSVIGWLVFGQKLDSAAIIGISLILAGVLILNLASKSLAH